MEVCSGGRPAFQSNGIQCEDYGKDQEMDEATAAAVWQAWKPRICAESLFVLSQKCSFCVGAGLLWKKHAYRLSTVIQKK